MSKELNFRIVGGWTLEDFRLYIRATLIELIKLELENLPREEWEKTLNTWKKICSFCKAIMKKEEKERHELYRRFGFDATMTQISESVIEKLQTAQNLGLIAESENPDKIIELGLEGMEAHSEVVAFMKDFFKTK
ncbi:MAG: hypothetical protein NZ827_05410 [Aquificaceae bacterium]|nr:hypothetical protein [Aquificaceae bacterium]